MSRGLVRRLLSAPQVRGLALAGSALTLLTMFCLQLAISNRAAWRSVLAPGPASADSALGAICGSLALVLALWLLSALLLSLLAALSSRTSALGATLAGGARLLAPSIMRNAVAALLGVVIAAAPAAAVAGAGNGASTVTVGGTATTPTSPSAPLPSRAPRDDAGRPGADEGADEGPGRSLSPAWAPAATPPARPAAPPPDPSAAPPARSAATRSDGPAVTPPDRPAAAPPGSPAVTRPDRPASSRTEGSASGRPDRSAIPARETTSEGRSQPTWVPQSDLVPGWTPGRPFAPESPATAPGTTAPRPGTSGSIAGKPSPATGHTRRRGIDRDDEIVVRRGDTLWSLAGRHLGPGATDSEIALEWPHWFTANQAVIGPDPDHLVPGERLRPPPTDADEPADRRPGRGTRNSTGSAHGTESRVGSQARGMR